VILPVGPDKEQVLTTAAKQCTRCGYLHPVPEGVGPDLCERCREPLPNPLRPLFRLQNVATKRAERINSDEEERLRLGYDLWTGVRFAMHGQQPSRRLATVNGEKGTLAMLTYGHAATLWRINLGWRRRSNKDRFGFVLDLERGYWERSPGDVADDEDDPHSHKTKRVIPYVEDRRNCLLVEPVDQVPDAEMASLQAALKSAIQVEYQLEDGELAAEPLPAIGRRRLLLLYEAAEGGAGVLRRLLDDPKALSRTARCALELCHFDPDSGEDKRRAPRASEDCEAACYDCLMSYTNQPDHQLLDRTQVKSLLEQLSKATVEASPGEKPRAEHVDGLRRLCGSTLERDWLDLLEAHNLALPSRAQVFLRDCETRPDFVYDEHNIAIYVDGPHHDFRDRAARDVTQTSRMEDIGWTVLRFGMRDDWLAILRQHPGVFGRLT
jgi:very-short-patch-repair endonuclease